MVGIALNTNKIEVLWSGGWDSTFMLCYLAKTFPNAIIQPYYLNIDRPIQKQELQSIRKIFKLLKTKKDLKAKILSPKIVEQKFLSPDKDVCSSYSKLCVKPYNVGGQYKFIAQFAKSHPGICWGQERYFETPGHLTSLFHDKGNIKFDIHQIGYFVKEDCDNDVFTIFGNLSCPIMHFSELMMLEKIKEWHYEDIFKLISFCYFPIDNEPCGICYYCETKHKQNMTMLFSDKALARKKVYDFLQLNSISLFPNDSFLKDFTIAKAFHLYQSDTYKKSYLSSFKEIEILTSVESKINNIILLYKDYFDNLFIKALHNEDLAS